MVIYSAKTTIALALGAVAMPADSINAMVGSKYAAKVDMLPRASTGPDATTEAFLNHYQPLSDDAAKFLGMSNEESEPTILQGLCSSHSPCRSIERVGTTSLGSADILDEAHITGLLNQLLGQSEQTLDSSHPNLILNGLHTEYDGLVLEIIAPPRTIPSRVLGGLVLDMYKAQVSNQETTNAVRAVPSDIDDQKMATMALCLFPATADPTQSTDFCLGKRLGTAAGAAPVQRRQSGKAGIFSLFASIFPLLFGGEE